MTVVLPSSLELKMTFGSGRCICLGSALGLICLVGASNSMLKRGLRTPAELCETADVEQFAWRTIRARRVELDFTLIADDLGDYAREFSDRDVITSADIDQLGARIGFH